MRTLNCLICGKEFETNHSREKTCGKECSRKHKNKLTATTYDRDARREYQREYLSTFQGYLTRKLGVLKARGREFNLTYDDLRDFWYIQRGLCALTCVTLKIGAKDTKHMPSVDRKDNSKGYTRGNIQWVSQWANRKKGAKESWQPSL